MTRRAARRQAPLVVPASPDDLTGNLHRQVVGYLGALLPIVVVAVDHLWPSDGLTSAQLTSISAYYYTSSVAVFIGVLAALAVYLLTYKGYKNDHRWQDVTAAIVAGCAAAVVALFPTAPPNDATRRSWWHDWHGTVHIWAAGILFVSFAYFSLWLFSKTAEPAPLPEEKVWRNRIYYVCGVGILACLVWVVVAARADRSIFLPETLALELFAASWLTKGKSETTAWRLLVSGARLTGIGQKAAAS